MNAWIWIGIAALLLGLFVVGCQRSPVEERPDDGGDLPMVRMQTGSQSGAACEGLVICRDQASFQELWTRHNGRQLPAPALPEVDFDEHYVVCVFAGDRSSAGYSVSIDAIRPYGQGVTVFASEEVPPGDMMQAAVMTSPFDMVAVVRFEGSAELEWVGAASSR